MAKGFEEAFTEIADESLKEFFSEPAAKIIYDFIESRYGIKPQEIGNNLDTFAAALEAFLSSGAFVIENLIAKRLYEYYDAKFETKQGYKLVDYVKMLRQTKKR
ncbi:MAG: hypothetical protein QXM22_05440 [Candidatus Bathyarchaeia archaeon]